MARNENHAKNKVDIRPLKLVVFEKFPLDSPLRATILGEKDVMSAEELVSKAETWLLLLRSAK
ncbi:MAG: hypothetical protein ABSF44_09640 [Candidatus Bathyarchaeia archaeon]|jgi:hypothetical protein